MRDASTEAGKKLSSLSTDLNARKDVFENIKAFSETEEAKHLDPEPKKYLEEYIRDGKRGGLDLPDAKLEQYKTLTKKISDLGTDFRTEMKTKFWNFFTIICHMIMNTVNQPFCHINFQLGMVKTYPVSKVCPSLTLYPYLTTTLNYSSFPSSSLSQELSECGYFILLG